MKRRRSRRSRQEWSRAYWEIWWILFKPLNRYRETWVSVAVKQAEWWRRRVVGAAHSSARKLCFRPTTAGNIMAAASLYWKWQHTGTTGHFFNVDLQPSISGPTCLHIYNKWLTFAQINGSLASVLVTYCVWRSGWPAKRRHVGTT